MVVVGKTPDRGSTARKTSKSVRAPCTFHSGGRSGRSDHILDRGAGNSCLPSSELKNTTPPG